MNKRKARQIGIRQTLLATTYGFLLGEILLFLKETNGDLANGILFFMQAQGSPVILGAIFFLFLPSFLFGRQDGVEIVINGRNPALIAIKYALIAIAGVALIIVLIVRSYNLSPEDNNKILVSGISPIAAELLGIWLFAGWRIKIRSLKQ